MHYTYPRSFRVFRLSHGMQAALDIAVAISVALFFSYLILHGLI